jgi:hypothetical protein
MVIVEKAKARDESRAATPNTEKMKSLYTASILIQWVYI